MNRSIDDQGMALANQQSKAVRRALDSMRESVDAELDELPDEAPRLSEAFEQPRQFVRSETPRMPYDPPPPPGPLHRMSPQIEAEIIDRLDEIEAKLANLEARVIQILQQVSKISRR